MSGGVTPPIVARPPRPPTGPNDCSDSAQDWRRWKLGDLLDKLYAGVESVSDRGRSVNYLGADDLRALADDLKGEIAMCENGGRPLTKHRVFTVPYSKWL